MVIFAPLPTICLARCMTSSVKGNTTLRKALGLHTATALVIGGMIGSGIFKNPSSMANLLFSPELLIAVWIVAGVVTLFGALTNAEIASMIPVTGGQYEYFRVIYGEFIAFLYGWALFFVIQSGSIASITYVFSYYLDALIPLPVLPQSTVNSVTIPLPFGTIYPLFEIGIKCSTAAVIFLLTMINVMGVKHGGRFQVVFTIAKVSAIFVLVAVAFSWNGGSSSNFSTQDADLVPVGGALLAAIVMAMNKALWAYDGWNNITYVAGEISNARRNIPLALMFGTATVLAVYIIINLAYLYVMPVTALGSSTSVAADVAYRAIGGFGLTFVSLSVLVSTLGTSNGTILVSSRVYYAMAKEGMFFRTLGYIHPSKATPSRSLWWQCVWTIMLVFTGTFDMLTDMLIFVSWAFYALGAIGVFVLRKRMPETVRPYRVWGYPILPSVFVFFACAFLVFTLYTDIDQYITAKASGNDSYINSVYGLVLLMSGLPFYYWFLKRRNVLKHNP